MAPLLKWGRGAVFQGGAPERCRGPRLLAAPTPHAFHAVNDLFLQPRSYPLLSPVAMPYRKQLKDLRYLSVCDGAIIQSMNNPKVKLWRSLAVSFIVIALMLFLPAGAIDYWQAWVYLGVGAVTSIPLVLYIAGDPILLENRTRGGPTAEQRPIQKIIVWCMAIPGIAAFVVPGLDHRFGWSNVPLWLIVAGNLLILLSMWMVYRVFKENSFGSATVEIAKDQKVISTGPYAIVRNPMYTSASIYFIGMSLALGSYWALIPSALIILGFVLRLLDEEKSLALSLPGYAGYCSEVRWHLIPGIF
jgi:protein-S-isoprenylcysteine O-methyltransferase Ste14